MPTPTTSISRTGLLWTTATVNPWVAARFTLPGIIAHDSALRDGERLPVPDFGEPPASLTR